MSSSDTSSDSEWLTDLELAVASGCDFNTVRMLAENRCLNEKLRARTWQVLLGVSHKPNPFVGQDELYNLSEQREIRTTCSEICESLGNDDVDRLSILSDLESVITLFCKTTGAQFSADNGWKDILQLLVTLRLDTVALYHLFHSVVTKYVAKCCCGSEKSFNLLRLILLYHEPELCAFLDSKRLSPSNFCKHWLNSLFSSTCELKVVLKLWDVYFQHADPFEVFFMAAVILINAKEQTLTMVDMEADQIAEKLSALPSNLLEDDVDDFYHLVRFYLDRTPQSYRRDYHGALFGVNFTEMADTYVLPVLCLPMSPQELLPIVMDIKNPHMNYVVVDTRPGEQFSAGHLRGSYSLDASGLLYDPESFNGMVATLEEKCRSLYVDFHWCFLSSGLEADDSLRNMCIAFLLKQNKRYITYASGGYRALHKLLKGGLLLKLDMHDERRCLVCLEESRIELAADELHELHVVSPFDFLDNASHNVFAKSAQALGKLKKAIKHSISEQKLKPRHVSPSSRHGKAYRGQASVFSIADDDDDVSDQQSSDDELNDSIWSEKVSLSDWLKADDVTASFDCKRMEKGGRFSKAMLVIKGDSLCVLILSDDVENEATVRAKHPLSSIGKITSRRMFPELLSFTFYPESKDGRDLSAKVEKFVVEKAGDCAKMVKQAILMPP